MRCNDSRTSATSLVRRERAKNQNKNVAKNQTAWYKNFGLN